MDTAQGRGDGELGLQTVSEESEEDAHTNSSGGNNHNVPSRRPLSRIEYSLFNNGDGGASSPSEPPSRKPSDETTSTSSTLSPGTPPEHHQNLRTSTSAVAVTIADAASPSPAHSLSLSEFGADVNLPSTTTTSISLGTATRSIVAGGNDGNVSHRRTLPLSRSSIPVSLNEADPLNSGAVEAGVGPRSRPSSWKQTAQSHYKRSSNSTAASQSYYKRSSTSSFNTNEKRSSFTTTYSYYNPTPVSSYRSSAVVDTLFSLSDDELDALSEEVANANEPFLAAVKELDQSSISITSSDNLHTWRENVTTNTSNPDLERFKRALSSPSTISAASYRAYLGHSDNEQQNGNESNNDTAEEQEDRIEELLYWDEDDNTNIFVTSSGGETLRAHSPHLPKRPHSVFVDYPGATFVYVRRDIGRSMTGDPFFSSIRRQRRRNRNRNCDNNENSSITDSNDSGRCYDDDALSLFTRDGLFPPRDDELRMPLWATLAPAMWVRHNKYLGSQKGKPPLQYDE